MIVELRAADVDQFEVVEIPSGGVAAGGDVNGIGAAGGLHLAGGHNFLNEVRAGHQIRE